MKILKYQEVDPLSVLNLNLLALDFALTPEHATNLFHTDPRPYPELAVYAVENEVLMGQVGVFRLPMISIEGREDVGGVWAVSTHPEYSGRGVATLLLDEAHRRMRESGLRFSTLGTNRYRVAHRLYRQHGYVETNIFATALASWETAHLPTRLRTSQPGAEGYDFVEKVYRHVAAGYLGFAWRHSPFSRLRRIELANIWILWQNDEPVGYALAQLDKSVLKITNLLLMDGIDAAEAVAAVVTECRSLYIQVTISRPCEIASLRRAGYQVANPDWGSFMVKPLIPEVSYEDAKHLFGIGTDRFLISWLDTT